MRKCLFVLFISLLSACSAFSQTNNIVDLLVKSEYSKIVRSQSKDYVCTLYIQGTNLNLIYESMGFTPSILAFKKANDSISLIIKSRWTGAEEPVPNEPKPVIYYRIVLTVKNAAIDTSCMKIDKPEIDGYTLNTAIVNDDNVNMRDEASIVGKKIFKANKGERFITDSVSSNYDSIDVMKDYWYLIKDISRSGWIFGYFIDFSISIDLRK